MTLIYPRIDMVSVFHGRGLGLRLGFELYECPLVTNGLVTVHCNGGNQYYYYYYYYYLCSLFITLKQQNSTRTKGRTYNTLKKKAIHRNKTIKSIKHLHIIAAEMFPKIFLDQIFRCMKESREKYRLIDYMPPVYHNHTNVCVFSFSSSLFIFMYFSQAVYCQSCWMVQNVGQSSKWIALDALDQRCLWRLIGIKW